MIWLDATVRALAFVQHHAHRHAEAHALAEVALHSVVTHVATNRARVVGRALQIVDRRALIAPVVAKQQIRVERVLTSVLANVDMAVVHLVHHRVENRAIYNADPDVCEIVHRDAKTRVIQHVRGIV